MTRRYSITLCLLGGVWLLPHLLTPKPPGDLTDHEPTTEELIQGPGLSAPPQRQTDARIGPALHRTKNAV
jgi:hypothetical protein